MTAISPFFVAQQERECDLNDVREAARKLARNFDLAYWRKCDKEEKYPWDFVNSFAKAGWMGILMPEEYGGMGLGVTEASIMLQEVAAVCREARPSTSTCFHPNRSCGTALRP